MTGRLSSLVKLRGSGLEDWCNVWWNQWTSGNHPSQQPLCHNWGWILVLWARRASIRTVSKWGKYSENLLLSMSEIVLRAKLKQKKVKTCSITTDLSLSVSLYWCTSSKGKHPCNAEMVHQWATSLESSSLQTSNTYPCQFVWSVASIPLVGFVVSPEVQALNLPDYAWQRSELSTVQRRIRWFWNWILSHQWVSCAKIVVLQERGQHRSWALMLLVCKSAFLKLLSLYHQTDHCGPVNYLYSARSPQTLSCTPFHKLVSSQPYYAYRFPHIVLRS